MAGECHPEPVSRFADVEGSRMHYLEVGSGDPILFLHGNPTSSYLWRNILPRLSSHGRCIALDLIGMGRSDKPAIDDRFVDHARYIEGFIAALGLTDITLVIHDWGAGLGLDYACRHPANVRAVALMEGVYRPPTSRMSTWARGSTISRRTTPSQSETRSRGGCRVFRVRLSWGSVSATSGRRASTLW